jgi:hypothetical protein
MSGSSGVQAAGKANKTEQTARSRPRRRLPELRLDHTSLASALIAVWFVIIRAPQSARRHVLNAESSAASSI